MAVPVNLTDGAIIQAGDIVTADGVQVDPERLARRIGTAILPDDKTDFVFHGLDLILDLSAKRFGVRIGSIPLALGAGAVR